MLTKEDNRLVEQGTLIIDEGDLKVEWQKQTI